MIRFTSMAVVFVVLFVLSTLSYSDTFTVLNTDDSGPGITQAGNY